MAFTTHYLQEPLTRSARLHTRSLNCPLKSNMAGYVGNSGRGRPGEPELFDVNRSTAGSAPPRVWSIVAIAVITAASFIADRAQTGSPLP